MVVGYHLIWTAYGWWLPNDPRGSSSHEIRVARIAELGELHHGRKAVQPRSPELRLFYDNARLALKHELLSFSAEAVALIAEAFAATIEERNYTCYACAIMQDHVHLLIRRHRDQAEVMLAHLQAGSRERLIQSGARAANHPVWGGPGWKRFLNTRADIERVIAYIRNNPIVARLPEQTWRFVKPYDGWLPRPARET
ncbi:MAG TPA: transposase [Gemmataceae bacterium]|nr:transposase [Gemmataceae bacterium]